MEDKYAAQKKYLSGRKQLRVWIEKDKYEKFESLVRENGESIYGVINRFLDQYIKAGVS